MNRSLKIRLGVILGVVLLCVYGVLGLPTSRNKLAANLKKHIRLGLDLRGGTQLVVQVQFQDAYKASADTLINSLKDALQTAHVPYQSIRRNNLESLQQAASIAVTVEGVPAASADEFQRTAKNLAGGRWVLKSLNLTDYQLTMAPQYAATLKQDTMKQTMDTLGRKINALGLSEASVQKRGGVGTQEGEMLIQLPGVSDPARIKAILMTAAVLNLNEVLAGPFASREDAFASRGGMLPLDSEMLGNGQQGPGAEYWILARSPVITGRDLRDARATQGPNGGAETEFFLTQEAARRFQRFTASHIGDRLAIVLDKVVLSAPSIKSEIRDSGVIEGLSGKQEAMDLALNLRSGSLPAGLEYLEENTVGPSLGADSIRDGLEAGVAGLIAVIVVLLVYYRRSGLNALLALLLNGLILLAVLSYAGAVLTLPGIAGVILTVGMAVDSNVLIFERIREELQAGKTVLGAVDAGFHMAFRTIVDTHITTMVSCGLLFVFGAGPVRGFAVTLVIGLAANIFTAVFVSRAVFDWELSRQRQVETLSI